MSKSILHEELEEFVEHQAAEDAFLTNGERQERAEVVRQIIGDHNELDPAQVQDLIDKYLGQIALYRGEKSSTDELNQTIAVDLSKIGWLKDQVREGEDGAVQVRAERIAAPTLVFDFIDLTDLDNVTNACKAKLKARGDLPRLTEKIRQQEIPQLWDDIRSGRGRNRPISIGSGHNPAQALSSGRILRTEYPGYKIYLHRKEVAAILLVLGKNEQEIPCFGLAALYDQKDQERIWGEMMGRKSSGRH